MLYFFFEWWCTAGATVHSKGVGSLEIRHLERVDLHALPDSGVVWTGEWVKKSYDGHNRKQAARHRSLNNYKQSSANRSKFCCALCRFIWVRRGHAANQTGGEALSSLDMDKPALEASSKQLEQQLTQLSSQQKAQQPLSKRLESAREALQRAPTRAEEAKVAFALTERQRTDGPGSPNSAYSSKKLTKQVRKPQAHAHSTAAQTS